MGRALPPDFDGRLLPLLADRRLTYSDIAARLGCSLTAVQRHAAGLRQAGHRFPERPRGPKCRGEIDPVEPVHLDRGRIRRRLAARYAWQDRRRRLGLTAAGHPSARPVRVFPVAERRVSP